MEPTVKTLRCLPRNVISQRVNNSKQVHHKLMSALKLSNRAGNNLRRMSEAGGEGCLTDCSFCRTQKTAARSGHSRDSSPITSDLTKVAGCLLTPTVANTAAADSAPSGSAPNCQTSCTILFKGQVLKPASTKQNVLTDMAKFKLYLFNTEFQRSTQHGEET